MKIPIKPILKTVKNVSPIVADYAKKNPKATIAVMTGAGKAGKELFRGKASRFEQKQSKGKVHYRKLQYLKYHNEILPNLDSYSYIQLNSFKQEVETYIKQIKKEEESQLGVNKPIHGRRIKSWQQIKIQIEDKIETKNYSELLEAYNNNSYSSKYFEDKVIADMRELENPIEVCQYIYRYTKKDMKDIERDFS